ncbi:MAG TPA: TonB family protein [Blastocatellia bacterium]|nr:TonB family protein [Blastocatellia bacterium]
MNQSRVRLIATVFVLAFGFIITAQAQADRQQDERPAPPKVIRKSGGVLAAEATNLVNPAYPPLAKAARVSGSVVVEVTIDEEGNVIAARAISGHPLLKDAAVDAARGWKFKPTLLSGQPVKVIGTITFNFHLDNDKEIEALKEKINANPGSAELHYELANLYKGSMQYEKAIEEYKQALSLEPNHAGAYLGLGDVYEMTGRGNEAIETYKDALNAHPNSAFTEGIYMALGSAYFKQERNEEALEAYKQVAAINPNSQTAHFLLGRLYLRLGDKQSAANEAAILKNLDPAMAEALRRLIDK